MAGQTLRTQSVVKTFQKHIQIQKMIKDNQLTDEGMRKMANWAYDMIRELADDLNLLELIEGGEIDENE